MHAATSREALTKLYEDTGHLVLRRCVRLLGDPQEAMDVTQWTYLRAFEVGFEVRSPGQSLAWLYKTAQLRCLWLMRNGRNRSRLRGIHREELLSAPMGNLESQTVSKDLVQRALAQVDERTAEVALLTWQEGLSNLRAAELVGISVRSVGRHRRTFEDVIRALHEEGA